MANAHKHKGRYVRGVTDSEWAELGEAATAAGTDRSAIIRALLAWYLGQPDAELPERPAPSGA